MEIERKYLLKELPDLGNFEHHKIEQAYLCTGPVVRVRREDEIYYMTYKGSGMMSREEYNLPLTRESYEHLKVKADGNVRANSLSNLLKQTPELHAFRYSMKPYVEQEQMTCYPLYAIQ